MKLSRERLKQIIKEELGQIEEAEEYMVPHGYHGRPHRYEERGPEVKSAREVIAKMMEKHPKLMAALQIKEDHLEQHLAAAYDSALGGGSRNPQQRMTERFWSIVEKIL